MVVIVLVFYFGWFVIRNSDKGLVVAELQLCLEFFPSVFCGFGFVVFIHDLDLEIMDV